MTVSISANGINGQDFRADDGGAQARSSLVRQHLARWADWMGSSHINAVMHVADMPHWKTVKNLTLFAEEVIPRLRKGAPQRIAAE